MSDRSDYLRSMFRGFAEGAGRRLGIPLQSLQKLLRESLAQASSVSELQITKALTRVEGVREASVVCREPRIWIEATLGEERVSLSVEPLGARFAPRGAKELVFRIDPAELAGKSQVRDLVGALAALVAHTLWGPFLSRSSNVRYDAIAEREGDEVRVDLRSVPAVRSAQQRGLAQMFDVLELSGLHVHDGALRLHVKLPALFAP
jgi:hypothetical protein